MANKQLTIGQHLWESGKVTRVPSLRIFKGESRGKTTWHYVGDTGPQDGDLRYAQTGPTMNTLGEAIAYVSRYAIDSGYPLS